MKVDKVLSTRAAPDLVVTQVTQIITKCPLPSRIFHGRRIILDQMHQFFEQDQGKQHIFLLHGLGGAGKTQTALRFIEESSSCFSDIFLIDTSTVETINTGLKNIAVTRNVGSTADDALRWLSTQPAEWLLLFDNADDPNINLQMFFPACTHGNILITSRNPGLRVYTGAHSLVSDMEELDAVELLLTSAGEDFTSGNRIIAADIVKALWYLPLAIIQAGAFISKSGLLDKYLDLYKKNQAKLLREKPTQSHADYAWTVYTTWQISFDQLSQLAKTLLQLWSFLHHEGITEDLFSHAATYKTEWYPQGPSDEELQEPLEFLSQFLGPDHVWDALRFIEIRTEIRSYSLVNFDPNKKTFSVHPLVHSWTQTTLIDPQSYHHSMVAIVGMAIADIPWQDMQLASVKLLPHVDSLIHGNGNVKPDFCYQYGVLYWWADRFKDAEQLQLAALEDRRDILDEDHPDTLLAMGDLASTYYQLGQLKEAEELGVVVLEKWRKILGEDYPDTLHAMGNLASTYRQLGQLKEAEELEVVVLEKQRKILGEDHPETLHAMGNLASTYHKLGQLKEAEELEVVVLEKRKKVLGEDHPDTLRSMANLAATYYRLGRFTEAETLYVDLLAKRKAVLGDDHPDTRETLSNLAATQRAINGSRNRNRLNRFF
ncbi:P-loop containing nucleoside triphosphate hydrolase protein [Mycena rosella]|uniref:P-loop containing nucleoside triphosphate hydrolase protein n=1 Tax=Mycena rosella TaxID=1033263 RepID=A0AAD7CPS8_MYCRO|nr:P-loop containing nucleoside triphosphate hydrolase protein [Mycena rosella]